MYISDKTSNFVPSKTTQKVTPLTNWIRFGFGFGFVVVSHLALFARTYKYGVCD